eukprot:s296_g9.t1
MSSEKASAPSEVPTREEQAAAASASGEEARDKEGKTPLRWTISPGITSLLGVQAPPVVAAAAAAADRVGAALEESLELQDLDSGPLQRKCRPDDPADFLQRLQSFRPAWWFHKPAGISPLDCARRGWVNTGLDMLRCECCGEELKIERVEGTWLCNGKPMGSESEVPSAAAFAEVLEQGHSGFCPWRSSQVVLNDPLRECDQDPATYCLA